MSEIYLICLFFLLSPVISLFWFENTVLGKRRAFPQNGANKSLPLNWYNFGIKRLSGKNMGIGITALY